MFAGGLGYSPGKIGAVLGIASAPMIFLNLVMFPFLVTRFTLKKVSSIMKVTEYLYFIVNIVFMNVYILLQNLVEHQHFIVNIGWILTFQCKYWLDINISL